MVLLCAALCASAEDRTQPTIESMIGGWLFNSEHSYQAESQVHLPLLRVEPFSLSYDEREVTPVLRERSQTQLLTTRNDLTADFNIAEPLRLIAVGGYHRTAFEDRPGSFGAYEIGGGIGSPIRPEWPRLEWWAVAGGYAGRDRLAADWWTDLHAEWRVYEFGEGQMLETSFQPSLGLAADVESANTGDRFRALYRIGPVLEVMSANGNRARFEARWYANDGNPFFETRYSGLFLGVGVTGALEKDAVFDARDHRPIGWLPLIWGRYDVGYGGDRSIQRTELDAEIHDIKLADQIITAVLWYESRQEFRSADFDNVSYSVRFGLQTAIGLESLVSQGKPLVAGIEYLHRSAHALAPEAERVPPGETLPHSSLNLAPRFRLQTRGWDLPYRDPARYQPRTEWLNDFDWRVTVGYDFYHSRDRGNPAAQLDVNWDVATLQGSVIYLQGIGSIGDETPDWLVEFGVRRLGGEIFVRAERYGLERQLARGNTIVAGIGFHL